MKNIKKVKGKKKNVEIIGYNCKKCRGKNFIESGRAILHVCEGFAEPVFLTTPKRRKK